MQGIYYKNTLSALETDKAQHRTEYNGEQFTAEQTERP